MHRGPFAYAFRTFFLAVAVSALVLVPVVYAIFEQRLSKKE